jgi:hypothetical protein
MISAAFVLPAPAELEAPPLRRSSPVQLGAGKVASGAARGVPHTGRRPCRLLGGDGGWQGVALTALPAGRCGCISNASLIENRDLRVVVLFSFYTFERDLHLQLYTARSYL